MDRRSGTIAEILIFVASFVALNFNRGRKHHLHSWYFATDVCEIFANKFGLEAVSYLTDRP
ncbi:hypothetical protein ABIB75_006933 [Bradyrhizobium sp. GM2.2]